MNANRRNFLKTSAVASAAVMIMPSCLSGGTSTASPGIGLGLYTVREQMANDPRGTLEQIAKIGYKKIEPFGYDGSKLFGFTAGELKQICTDLDLEFTSGHINPPVFFEQFDTALEFMSEAGQQYAVFPWLSPEMRTVDQYKRIAETLNKCGEKAQSAGITVCYHNHDFEFDTVDGQVPMDILTSETDADLVKLELDLYWVFRAGVDPVAFFRKHEGRIPLWHVKDMDSTPEQGFAAVGEGVIDYKSLFEHKGLSGMKHFFVEQDQSADPMKSIETSYNNLANKILQ